MEDNNRAEEPIAAYETPLDFDKVWLMFQETDRQFKETDRLLTEKFQDTDKKLRRLEQLFTSQWGKLIESLVEGDLIKLLKAKGIQVERTLQRVKGNRNGENFEYDLVAVNGTEVVVVEVKTTLRTEDVEDFHRKLWKAKTYMPEYNERVIYGAMAYITADGSSDRMAEKLGFFIIRATGNSSSIVNSSDFKPKAF